MLSFCWIFFFQVHDLEFAQIETQVLAGLKAGNESLKKMHEVYVDLITEANREFTL